MQIVEESAEISLDLTTQELATAAPAGTIEVDDIASVDPAPAASPPAANADRATIQDADPMEIEMTAEQMGTLLGGQKQP